MLRADFKDRWAEVAAPELMGVTRTRKAFMPLFAVAVVLQD